MAGAAAAAPAPRVVIALAGGDTLFFTPQVEPQPPDGRDAHRQAIVVGEMEASFFAGRGVALPHPLRAGTARAGAAGGPGRRRHAGAGRGRAAMRCFHIMSPPCGRGARSGPLRCNRQHLVATGRPDAEQGGDIGDGVATAPGGLQRPPSQVERGVFQGQQS